MTCSFCGGAYHPASGCCYGVRVVACGPCVRDFWAWFRRHQHPRKGRSTSFYDAAAMWPQERAAAEARQLATLLLDRWGSMPGYRGTITWAVRLARLTLDRR